MRMRRVILAAIVAFVPALAAAQTGGGKNAADGASLQAVEETDQINRERCARNSGA